VLFDSCAFFRLPGMRKITCKFKDEIISKYSVSEIVATKPNACYVNKELTCLGQIRALVIFNVMWKATSSRKLLEMKPVRQK